LSGDEYQWEFDLAVGMGKRWEGHAPETEASVPATPADAVRQPVESRRTLSGQTVAEMKAASSARHEATMRAAEEAARVRIAGDSPDPYVPTKAQTLAQFAALAKEQDLGVRVIRAPHRAPLRSERSLVRRGQPAEERKVFMRDQMEVFDRKTGRVVAWPRLDNAGRFHRNYVSRSRWTLGDGSGKVEEHENPNTRDPRIVRPTDEPTQLRVDYDWHYELAVGMGTFTREMLAAVRHDLAVGMGKRWEGHVKEAEGTGDTATPPLGVGGGTGASSTADTVLEKAQSGSAALKAVLHDEVFTPAERQLPSNVRQPFTTQVEAYQKANGAQELIRSSLDHGKGLDKAIGAVAYEARDNNWHTQLPPSGPAIVFAPIKSRGRAVEKVTNKFDGDWSRLSDLVRASILVDRYEEIPGVLAAMRAEMKKNSITFAEAPENRIARPLDGYEDIALKLRLPDETVVEVLIISKPVALVKQGEGHVIFERMREIREKKEPPTAEELAELTRLKADSERVYRPATDASKQVGAS
jgi:hypothetical protein